jgi:hypothetical protein
MDLEHPEMIKQQHYEQLLRDATRRELEAEVRGLIMAARMNGYLVQIEGDGMVPKVVDVRPAP